MRIRKRFPPSSLSSASHSDPQLKPPIQSSAITYPDGNLCVQQDITDSQPSNPPNPSLPPPSDHRLIIGSGCSRWASSCASGVKQQGMEGEEIKEERWREEEKSRHDTRKGSILPAVGAGTQVLPKSLVGEWCERDKAVPLKKRRGSFERSSREQISVAAEKEKKMIMKTTKTNKKCMQHNGEDDGDGDGEDDDDEEKEGKVEGTDNNTRNITKKSKRGSVIMEGSRCSRVNGRGWRCCQQTLVGYSLCEHHLGKGRLRSITSVPSSGAMPNATPTAAAAAAAPEKKVEQTPPLSTHLQAEEEGEKMLLDDDMIRSDGDRKPLMLAKKRTKLGTVKARSMSSLLGQTNNITQVVITDNNKNSGV